ncbi:MAG TPA: C39 family peptidase [Candidatus Baltobacteraceae bacterium]|nr:C39 family peptidase [Candidatus Baltobacteraceae bacterium]
MEHLEEFSGFAQVIGARETARLLLAPTRGGVLSWNTFAPEGRIEFRLLQAHAPATPWMDYAEWHPTGSKSFSPDGGGVHVEVDVLTSDQLFDGVEVRARDVDFNLVAFSSPGRPVPSLPYARDALILDVPARSQYPSTGLRAGSKKEERGWCSAASVSMANAYHGIDVSVEETARHIFDRAYNGTGNWSFNVAFSGSLGLRGVVGHFRNLDHAQRLIERNVPLVISYSWASGELPDAPLERSDGHLVVLCGFTGSGDCAINDPAAPNVRVVYQRAAIERIWQRNNGVAYVIAPAGIEYADVLST